MTTISAKVASRISSQGSSPRNRVRGEWFSIKVCPDPFSAEYLNAGVGFIDGKGIVHCRFATHLERLKCFYDSRVDVESVALAIAVAETFLEGAHKDTLASLADMPFLKLGNQSFAAGASIDSILHYFFDNTVSLRPGIESSIDVQPRFRSMSDDAAQKLVISELAMGWARVAHLLQQSSGAFNVPNDVRRTLYFPLRVPGRAAGKIVSARISNPDLAELRILRAEADIRSLRDHVQSESGAIFVLRPELGTLGASQAAQIDENIDKFTSILGFAGIRVVAEDSPRDLAMGIATWAEELQVA